MGVILKVLNVNAAARHLTAGYSGPLIQVSEDPLLRDVRGAAGQDRRQLSNLATEAFSSLAAPPAHATVDVNTFMGFSCAAAAVFDAGGKPMAARTDLMEPGIESGLVK